MNGRTNAVAGTKLPALSNPAGAGQILNGYQAIGADGSIITGTIPSRGAQTVTPGRSNQTIAAGQYLSGTQTIAGDTDLTAGNIRSGVNIFGVSGGYEGEEVVFEQLSGYISGQSIKLTTARSIKKVVGFFASAYRSDDSSVLVVCPTVTNSGFAAYAKITSDAEYGAVLSFESITPSISGNEITINTRESIVSLSLTDGGIAYIPA